MHQKTELAKKQADHSRLDAMNTYGAGQICVTMCCSLNHRRERFYARSSLRRGLAPTEGSKKRATVQSRALVRQSTAKPHMLEPINATGDV